MVAILNAMPTSSVEKKDERDLFYAIIKSRFPNCTMSPYKLYQKAQRVKRMAEPRKSSRRGKSSSSAHQMSGNDDQTPMKISNT